MQQLQHLLTTVKPLQTKGSTAVAINGLAIDSRQVKPGFAFIAIAGTLTDGHEYITQALDNGAVAILCERLPQQLVDHICYVQLGDTATAAGYVSAAFYEEPSTALKVIGITGTNGKTTTATLLFDLFTTLGYTCGLLSTVANRIGGYTEASTHTTPDAISVQAMLRRMRDEGCSHVFMEVSSHAIHQGRINGIHFAGGIFTNITHDHLDYHHTFDEYIRVKKMFFDGLSEEAFALTNVDDKRGAVMLQNTNASKESYSLRVPASFKGKVLENTLTGLVLSINAMEVHCRLIGIFNAYNLLAVYGTAMLLGEEKMEVLAALSALVGAAGRFETYRSPVENILGIVDYAHTPDALINVLATINQLRTDGQRVITVIGCGGDRDKSKRALMAEVVAEHSSQAIFTADNPRNESPEAILDDMEVGLAPTLKRKTLRIADRKEAVRTACMLARSGDVILVAGKGHETYQEVKGIRHPFDDKEILTKAFLELGK